MTEQLLILRQRLQTASDAYFKAPSSELYGPMLQAWLEHHIAAMNERGRSVPKPSVVVPVLKKLVVLLVQIVVWGTACFVKERNRYEGCQKGS